MFRFEIPTLFSSLAILFPSYEKSVTFLYYLSSFKYCVFDIYSIQQEYTENLAVFLPLAFILLMNIGKYSYLVSSQMRRRLQSELCGRINDTIVAHMFVFRAAAFALSGQTTPPMVILYMTLGISAHAYYTEKDRSYNYLFYICAYHFVMMAQIWETLCGRELMYFSMAAHFLACMEQIYVHYYTENDSNVNEFITHFCTSLDYLILHVALPSASMFQMWTGSIELYLTFMMLYFETFGKLTQSITQFVLMHHAVTVSRVCYIR